MAAKNDHRSDNMVDFQLLSLHLATDDTLGLCSTSWIQFIAALGWNMQQSWSTSLLHHNKASIAKVLMQIPLAKYWRWSSSQVDLFELSSI